MKTGIQLFRNSLAPAVQPPQEIKALAFGSSTDQIFTEDLTSLRSTLDLGLGLTGKPRRDRQGSVLEIGKILSMDNFGSK